MIQRREIEQGLLPEPIIEYTCSGCGASLLGLADPEDEPVEWIEQHSECLDQPQPTVAEA